MTIVLWVGDSDRREFREAGAALEGLVEVRCAADVEHAAALLAGAADPVDLIVIAAAYPGQYSADQIDHLRRLAPLAPVVGLLGSWCEGEARSGKPWPGVVRVYWHQWPARCRQELDLLRRGAASVWSLPPTASEEERILAGFANPPVRQIGNAPVRRIGNPSYNVLLRGEHLSPRANEVRGLVAIYSPEFEMFSWLSAACRRAGHSTVWVSPRRWARFEGAAAGVFDATECRGSEADDLKRLAADLAPAPVVALVNFPRVEDFDRIRAAGAAAVLSKPVLIQDLVWRLSDLGVSTVT